MHNNIILQCCRWAHWNTISFRADPWRERWLFWWQFVLHCSRHWWFLCHLAVHPRWVLLCCRLSVLKVCFNDFKDKLCPFDFVPNIGPHPPTAHVWDSTKWKIKVKFILLFRLFRAFYFFEKMRNFSDKIPKFQNLWGLKASWNGQIWPPHLCITCFRTFLDVCSKNNWMDIFTKKFGTFDLDLYPPTHSLGQSPK